MKLILLILILLPVSIMAASDNVYVAQLRFKNGMVTNTEIVASNWQGAKEIAQSQCGGPQNCTVVVYKK